MHLLRIKKLAKHPLRKMNIALELPYRLHI